MKIKIKKINGVCYHCTRKGYMSWDYWERKYGNISKKFEKAEKAIDGDEDEVVLCLLMMACRRVSVKKKVWFAEDVKQPSKAGMMCTINVDSFYSFTKNTWNGDSGASCHITNNDTNMFDVTDINESIQGSSSIMPTTKKGKLCINV